MGTVWRTDWPNWLPGRFGSEFSPLVGCADRGQANVLFWFTLWLNLRNPSNKNISTLFFFFHLFKECGITLSRQHELVNRFQRGEFVQTVKKHSSCVLTGDGESEWKSAAGHRQLDVQHTTVLSKITSSELFWASVTTPQNNKQPQTFYALTSADTSHSSQALQADVAVWVDWLGYIGLVLTIRFHTLHGYTVYGDHSRVSVCSLWCYCCFGGFSLQASIKTSSLYEKWSDLKKLACARPFASRLWNDTAATITGGINVSIVS